MNGKNSFNCSAAPSGSKCQPNAPLSKFRFQSGKTYKLRLINSGAAAVQRFSIDGHKLQVITNDFTPIVPYTTDVVTLGVGQRSDVLVHAIGQQKESYWMRSTLAKNCTRSSNEAGNYAKAIVLYEKADPKSVPETQPYFLPELHCANDDLAKTVPLFPIAPTPNPDTIQVIEIDFKPNATGNNVFLFNNKTYFGNYNDPLLLKANRKDYKFDPKSNVFDFGKARSVRLVINSKYVGKFLYASTRHLCLSRVLQMVSGTPHAHAWSRVRTSLSLSVSIAKYT